MKAYRSIFRIRFIQNLQYRTVVLGAVLMRFFWGLMEVLAYRALFRMGENSFSMTFAETVNYVWMAQIFLFLFKVVFGDGEIYSAIQTGSIAYELIRPVDLYGRWFFQSMGNRVAPTLLNGLPAAALAFLLPAPYGLSLPPSMGHFLLFLLSAVLALGVVVSIAMLMYISLFYIISQRGIKIIVTAVTAFLSGGVIPLAFFPQPLLAAVKLLPFAAMQNTPLEIYCGAITLPEIRKSLTLQVFWLVTLILLGRFFMQHVLKKKITVQGG